VLLYVRIAITGALGVASVLLLLAWAVSYWRFDQLIGRTSAKNYLALTSFQGRFVCGWSDDPQLQVAFAQTWNRRGFRTKDWDAALRGPIAFFPATVRPTSRVIPWPQYNRNPFITAPGTNYREIVLPYWMMLLFTTAAAASPWFRWRFSLRALLIAITVIGLILGTMIAMN
jgi:hypothetical protein